MHHLTRSLVLAGAALVAFPGLALAHAHLRSARPAVGSTVHTAPQTVEITFSEAVEPTLSTIEVKGPDGKAVSQGQPHTGADGKHLIVTLDHVTPGTYHVVWHATSVDTHKTDGAFTFTVAP